MENRNSTNRKAVSIPENTDLNDLKLYQQKPVNSDEESKTLMQKFILQTVVLKMLLDEIDVIDFEYVASKGKVAEIRQKISETTDQKLQEKLNEKIKKFTPEDDGKYVIIIRYLLYVAEKNNCGLAIRDNVFYIYDGGYWKEYDSEIIKGFLESVAVRSGLNWIKAQQFSVKDKLLKQFISTATFKTNHVTKDVKINLLNGTLHIDKVGDKAPELRNPNREDFCTYQLPFNYDPTAKSPLFMDYLNRVLPDKICQDILFEFLGYVFTDMKLEKALFLTGPGGNGKSVVFEVMKALLGDVNVSYHTMDDLCDSKGYHRADLNKKLLNYQPEIRSIKDMDMFKKFVSGEPVDARLPFGNPFTISKYCKFMFNANKMPNVEHTWAFFRRIRIIPFNVTIPENEKDADLHNKIINTELSGVLNLVLEGLKRLITQSDFTKSPITEEQLEKYQKETDNVQLFLDDEGWVKSLTNRIPLKVLYQFYRDSCESGGYHALQRNNFVDRLENYLGFKIVRKTTNNGTYVYCEKIEDIAFKETMESTKIVEEILGISTKK